MAFIERELRDCAEMSAELDMRMQKLQMIANNIKTKQD